MQNISSKIITPDIQMMQLANQNVNGMNSHSRQHHHQHQKQPDASKRVKRGVLATTIIGVATGTAIALKMNKFKINNIKNIAHGLNKLEYKDSVVPIIAASSIAGGLVGGAIFDDKRNMKAKFREAAIQMLANILIPLLCVEKGGNLFKAKVKAPIMDKFNLVAKGVGSTTKGKVVATLFDVSALVLSLGTAVVSGNKVSNIINEKIYNIRDDRDVKIADMSGHIDDTCLALSRSFDKSSPIYAISEKVARIIPLALTVCGYSSGIMQEWPDDVKAQRKINPHRPQL